MIIDPLGNIPIERGGTGGTTAEEAKEKLGVIGKDLSGQTVSVDSSTTATAGTGAEIFNDYREVTYSENGSRQQGNVATGNYSHAAGSLTVASGNYSHAEGYRTTASGEYSHAEGINATASGNYSHAEGRYTKASGDYSHAEGYYAIASGDYSHAEGYDTTASGYYSHAEGYGTTASVSYSHAEGERTTASGSSGSHAEGWASEALGRSSHAGGCCTTANNFQLAHGKYNKQTAGATGDSDTTGDIFIIGNGSAFDNRGNAFRVTTAGAVYGLKSYSSSGADYAEYFEWIDGNEENEDRRGYFVTLEGDKIRKATDKDEYILGAVSSTPATEGDTQSENWSGMYLKDVFGEKLTEIVEVEETTDESGRVIPAHTETRWVLNPEYDGSLEYKNRVERKEWSPIGLIGKLVVIDDGSCQVNGYCKPNSEGIATASESGYRVMKRLDNNHVRILLK